MILGKLLCTSFSLSVNGGFNYQLHGVVWKENQSGVGIAKSTKMEATQEVWLTYAHLSPDGIWTWITSCLNIGIQISAQYSRNSRYLLDPYLKISPLEKKFIWKWISIWRVTSVIKLEKLTRYCSYIWQMNSRMLNYKRKEICAEVEKYTADVWGIFFLI